MTCSTCCGEAHITSPEFARLKKKLTMRELARLAATVDLRVADLQAECLGVGET